MLYLGLLPYDSISQDTFHPGQSATGLVAGEGGKQRRQAYACICSARILSLINSFDVKQVCTPPTHKTGKDLNLVLPVNVPQTTSWLHLSHTFTWWMCVKHTHFWPLLYKLHCTAYFQLSLFSSFSAAPPPLLSLCCNLCNLSLSHFSSIVASAFPTLSSFSLEVNEATECLCSTLSSCLASLRLLSTKVGHSHRPQPCQNDLGPFGSYAAP